MKGKKQILLLIVFTVIFSIGVYVIYDIKQKENLLLTAKLDTVECVVKGWWHVKLQGNIFQYQVNDKDYEKHNRNYIKFKKGEIFLGNYVVKNPSIIDVDLTSPIVKNKDQYFETTGTITEIDSSSIPNTISILYTKNKITYERELYVKDSNTHLIEESCEIFVNKQDLEIFYLKSTVILD